MDLKARIRSVPDFPKAGIVFRDITTLIKDGAALNAAVEQLAAPWRDKRVDVVVGVEARGFILGAAVALKLGAGFVPMRKPGKLPAETMTESYELEYGADAVEMHADAIGPGTRALLIDDLIATGGTAAAACKLVERAGGEVVGCGFLIDLAFLEGTAKLTKYEVASLIRYESE
jgi:adenine phosphoribosyltransferase